MRVVMGSRTSPPAVAGGSKPPIRPVREIKKETQEDEIKEYAETAMNELLGWYGYDKVDRSDTQGLNLHHFAARRTPPSDLDSSDDSSSVGGRRDAGSGSSGDSPTPAEAVTVPPGCTVCGWCTKVVSNKQLFSVKTPGGQKEFCSEVCFSQCRRANFKRNKTCDWCRHIRHTVNYVDFQDGEHQLQFCSDKCLNQYKMNIFCRETQAHLQMHPHLQDGGPSSGLGLITPDLWLRDCRSVSPLSDRSLTPPSSPRHLPSPPPPPPPPPTETPSSERKSRPRKMGRRRLPATITSSSTPTDLRTNCSSPRSGDEHFTSKPNNLPQIHPIPSSSLMPPILHPPPHLFHERPPFMPHGLLPPPHMFPDSRYPLHRPHIRSSSPTNSRPLLTLPPNLPPPRPPFGYQHQHPPPRSLLPPVTIMVPYPIIIPVPVPIPIPIPIFTSRSKLSPEKEDADEKKQEDGKKEEGPVAAFLRLTSPPVPVAEVPEPTPTKAVPRQPLRKRKRMVDASNDDESIGKRTFVPV